MQCVWCPRKKKGLGQMQRGREDAGRRWHIRVTLWTVPYQAPLSMGFSRQEHWSGLPFPSPMHESEK